MVLSDSSAISQLLPLTAKQPLSAQNIGAQMQATDPMDFSSRYNTPIPPAKQNAFNQWAANQALQTGRNPLSDRYDYDVNGYWLSGGATDSRGHGPDTFKKPNHPTFSDESKYHGVDGYMGGHWGQGTYQPSSTNLQFRSPLELQQYFSQVEPDTKMLAPSAAQTIGSQMKSQ